MAFAYWVERLWFEKTLLIVQSRPRFDNETIEIKSATILD
jgi:hypothetical protein